MFLRGLALVLPILGVFFVLALIFSFRETLRDLGTIFDVRLIRTTLRSLVRFRLRTLLIVFSLFQTLLGVVIWQDAKGVSLGGILFLGGFWFLVIVFLGCCVQDFSRPTASRRWQSMLKRRSTFVNGPDPADPKRKARPRTARRFAFGRRRSTRTRTTG